MLLMTHNNAFVYGFGLRGLELQRSMLDNYSRMLQKLLSQLLLVVYYGRLVTLEKFLDLLPALITSLAVAPGEE